MPLSQFFKLIQKHWFYLNEARLSPFSALISMQSLQVSGQETAKTHFNCLTLKSQEVLVVTICVQQMSTQVNTLLIQRRTNQRPEWLV